MSRPQVSYKTVAVDGLNIFYREAGSPEAPTLLLLHGFPSSSFMFRDLLTELGDHSTSLRRTIRVSAAAMLRALTRSSTRSTISLRSSRSSQIRST